MKFAYLATDPKTNHSYAICSADPDYIADAAKEIGRWKKDGAVVELLSAEEAKERFCSSLTTKPKQSSLF